MITLPAWNMDRKEYFHTVCTKAITGGHTIWYVKSRPKVPHTYQEAVDLAMYDQEIGHFFVIQRQVERMKDLNFLTLENLIEYFPVWCKWFRSHPNLATFKPWR